MESLYQDYINDIKPLPVFNTRWNKEADVYSEGEVEDLVIKLLLENDEEDYSECICRNYNWSTYYHLTHLRQNILNWYPFSPDAGVLEIGCGFGAITNMLCDKCRKVTAVELSEKRALGTLFRCRNKSNLEIIVGNLNDIPFTEKYDYITLIGVLEYQGNYTKSSDPYGDFLRNVKKLLKPDGRLLIAIENKYGLKYWCGAREDHTGIPFDGLNQYLLSKKEVRTFSKKELNDLIHKSGYSNTFFYYPMPDYKLPTVVYSETCIPEGENMQNLRPYYEPDSKTLIANESLLYKDLLDNNVFEFFSNSFLVECSDADDFTRVTFAGLSSERLREYRIATVFLNGKVIKLPLAGEAGMKHIEEIYQNHNRLSEMGIKVLPSVLNGKELASDYCAAPLLEELIVTAAAEGSKEKLMDFFEKIWNEIKKSSDICVSGENLIFELGLDNNCSRDYGPVLKTAYIDMIARNGFFVDGEVIWFDQEWTLENVPARFVFYRNMVELYQSYPVIDTIVRKRELAEKFGLTDCIPYFERLNNFFYSCVMDQRHMAAAGVLRNIDINDCVRSVSRLLDI